MCVHACVHVLRLQKIIQTSVSEITQLIELKFHVQVFHRRID